MATYDLTTGYAGQLSDPVSMVATVTPNDGTDLPFVPTAIFVGAAGTLTLTPFKIAAAPVAGQASPGVTQAANVTLTLPVGWHPIRCTRILSTGTTATGIIIGTV